MNNYDLAIIGGGPAGVAAAVYAARKRLKTVFLTESFGGQSIVSPDIQNWVGNVSISGDELAKNFKNHVKNYEGEIFEIKEGTRVVSVAKSSDNFEIKTKKGETLNSKTLLITTGATRRKLEVPGASEFENKGITYCASCDGPLFADKDVIVIGGGNAGFETAAQLLAYTKSVTLLHRGAEFKADAITVKKVLSNPKMKAILGADTKEIRGDKFVESLVYEEVDSGERKELKTDGVFVEIGLIPATAFLDNSLEMTEYKQIKVDARNQKTSLPGIWAAGDCTNALYHQNNIAAGDGVKALEDIYIYLHAK